MNSVMRDLNILARAWFFVCARFAKRLERIADQALYQAAVTADEIERMRLRGIDLDKKARMARQSAEWIRANILQEI